MRWLHGYFGYVILILLNLPISGAPLIGFEVSVRFDVAVYGYAKSAFPVRSNRYSFVAHCVVAEEKWHIRSEFTKNAIEYFFYDGTNVCRTFQYKTNVSTRLSTNAALRARLGVSASRPTDSSFVTVIPGPHPLGDMGVNLPWLVYCSSRYSDETNRLIPIPGDSIRHSPSAFGYEHKTERFSDSLRLPSSVDWHASKDLLAKSANRALLIRTKKEAHTRAPFSAFSSTIRDGLLQCEYRVEETTNFNDFTIPVTFRLIQYVPSKTQSLAPKIDVRGTLQSLGLVTNVPSWPISNPSKDVYITDLRFRDKHKLLDAISYKTTNALIPATNSAITQQAFQVALARAPADPARKTQLAIFVLYVFLAVSLLPVAYIVYRRIREARGKAHV